MHLGEEMGKVEDKTLGGPAVTWIEPEIGHKCLCRGSFPVLVLEEEGN